MKNFLFILISISVTISCFGQTFEVNEQVMAFENDDMLWYKATILESGASKCKIHWEGFSSEYDEMMSNDNMWKEGQEFLVSDKLQGLETDGKWYNAKVLKRDLPNKKYFIHWGGFDSKYDRWIAYDSLRLPTKENYIAEGNFNTQSSAGSSSSGSGSTSTSNKVSFSFENKSGATVKLEYDTGGGAYSKTTANANSTTHYNSIVGGKLKVNGVLYKTFTSGDHNSKIVYK